MDSTKPENLISYTNIEVDGIVTFRGNSFRDAPSHGYADMTDFRLDKLWSADTGSLSSGSAVWTGSGWTAAYDEMAKRGQSTYEYDRESKGR